MSLLAPELSLALLETLFAEGRIGLALLDADLRYVRVSERYALITGCSEQDHVGRTPTEVVPDLAPELVAHMRAALETGTPQEAAVAGETPSAPGAQRTWHSAWHPVREGGETVGVAALVVETTDETRAAEERARLLALERRARERAEEAERRAGFLAEAGTLLDASLDLPTTLSTLARVVVPHLADLCIVDMLGPQEEVRRVAVAHTDRDAERLVWDLTKRWPSPPGSEVGIRRVLASGQVERLADITESVLVAAFPDPEHRALVRTLDLRAAVVAPLHARGRNLGAITFVRVGSRDAFSDPDAALALDLTNRASLAVDNARLHTDLVRAGRTQRFLSEASRSLATSLDLATTAQTVVSLVTRGIADGCAVEVVDSAGGLRTVAADHVDPRKREAIAQMRVRWPSARDVSAVGRAIASGRPQLVREFDPRRVRHLDPDQVAWLEGLALGSLIVVPLVARGRTLGALLLAITESSRRFDEHDLELAEELGRRAAVAADNARVYSERSRIARTLQRSLVPDALPTAPGLELAVRFRTAGDGTEVGGDFYDVWGLPGSRWAAVVGDVCGKGAGAAAFTALARHTLRAASHYEQGPAGVLAMLDSTLSAQAEDGQFCTAAHLWIEPAPGTARVRYASGGHLPPLLVRADGRTELLEAPGALLGVWASPEPAERETELAPGDAVVLYTDGVTEAGAPADAFGEGRLGALLAGLGGAGADVIAQGVLDAVLGHRPEPPRDDIAVLVIRLPVA